MSTTRRTQILMEPDEYHRLERIARRERVSVGELVRRAVRSAYLEPEPDRKAAVERMTNLSIPVGEWSELKRDLAEARDAGLP